MIILRIKSISHRQGLRDERGRSLAGFYILSEVRMNPKNKQTKRMKDRKKKRENIPERVEIYISSSYRKTVYIRNNFPKRFVGKLIVFFNQPCVHDPNTYILRESAIPS